MFFPLAVSLSPGSADHMLEFVLLFSSKLSFITHHIWDVVKQQFLLSDICRQLQELNSILLLLFLSFCPCRKDCARRKSILLQASNSKLCEIRTFDSDWRANLSSHGQRNPLRLFKRNVPIEEVGLHFPPLANAIVRVFLSITKVHKEGGGQIHSHQSSYGPMVP